MRPCKFTLAFAFVLSACTTSLKTTADRSWTDSNIAVGYESYSLPMLRFDISVEASLARCPRPFILNFKGETLVMYDRGLAIAVKPSAETMYVAGESYQIDHRALNSFFKTSSFSIEPWPSGTLKSIGASVTDETGPAIKDLVKTGVGIALASTGAPAGIPAAISAAGTLAEARSVNRSASPLFADISQKEDIIVCRDDAVTFMEEARRVSEELDVAATVLQSANNRVERAALIANGKPADRTDLMELKLALESQEKAADALMTKQVRQAALAKMLGTQFGYQWPNSFDETHSILSAGEAQIVKFAALLETRSVAVFSPEKLAQWLSTKLPADQAQFLRDNAAVLKQLKGADAGAGGCQSTDAKKCVSLLLEIEAIIFPTDYGTPRCRGSEAHSVRTEKSDPWCRRKLELNGETASSARLIDARDDKADQGVFYRQPVPGNLVLRSRDQNVRTASGANLLFAHSDAIPQLGQLRFFPFRSPAFTAREFSLQLQENGSLVKLEYKRTKAGGPELMGAAADAVDQLAKAKASIREEALAQLQYQLDVAKSQKDLLAAQEPDTPEEDAALKAETAHLNAEIANLTAKLTREKAMADYAAALNK
jgi:hypothetical protein